MAAGLSLIALSAEAAPLPRYGAFVFSSLCSERQSGDIGGSRIVLIRTPGFDELTFDYGAGGLTGSIVDKLTVAGDKLTAEVTAEGAKGTLTATLSADLAWVRFNIGGPPAPGLQRLARVKDFSRRQPVCR